MNSSARCHRRLRLVAAALAVGLLAMSGSALAEEGSPSTMDILRDKLRADKKLLVAANLDLTDAESKAFWPLYDEYQAELDNINRKLGATLDRYAEAWNAMTLSDDEAKSLMSTALSIEETEVALKKDYLERISGVIPPMKAVRYLQIENKIRAVIRFDLADSIPLVE
jgi:hypothetical protein